MAADNDDDGGARSDVVKFWSGDRTESTELTYDIIAKTAKNLDRRFKREIDDIAADPAWQYADEPLTAATGPAWDQPRYLACNRAMRRLLIDNMLEPMRSRALAELVENERQEAEQTREALR